MITNLSTALSWVASKTWLLLGLSLTILGAKLQVLQVYSVDIPFQDEWEADALYLFKPWEEGALHLSNFFAAHNEHRIFFTRVWELCWYALNGGWSPQLVMIANTVLHSFLAVILYLIFESALNKHGKVLFLFAIAFGVGMPYSTASVLVAFQSQFYFLMIFSALGIWLLVTREPFSLPWWGGMIAIGCAYFSVFAGLLGLIAVALVLALKFLRERSLRRNEWLTVGLLVVLFLIGYYFRAVVPGHARLIAVSAWAFISSFAVAIGWPHIKILPLGLLIYLPFGFFNLMYLRKQLPHNRFTAFLLGLGWWVLVIAAAAAYMRGASGARPADRYWDVLMLGVLVNLICVYFILSQSCNRSDTKEQDASSQTDYSRFISGTPNWLLVSALVWLANLGLGFYQSAELVLMQKLPETKVSQSFARQHLKDYFRSGNLGHLQKKPLHQTSFDGDPEYFASILSDPSVRKALPAPLNLASSQEGRFLRIGKHILAWGLPMMAVGLSILFSGSAALLYRNGSGEG